jgi:simple sugar transport system permease protein/ribose transport system permease protein
MAKLDPATTPVDPATTPVARRFVLPERLRDFGQTYGALMALLLIILYDILFRPHFLEVQSLYNDLQEVAPIAIIATGMTLVIATGGIDLSVGSLMAFAGALAPIIFLSPWLSNNPLLGNMLALIIPIIVTSLLGLFNGFLITRFRIQPIIATLILFIAGRGMALVLSNDKLQDFHNPGFQFIGQGRMLGIPFQVILMLIIVAVFAVIVRITTFGRYVLATGGNEAAARLAGIPVDRVKLTVYTISALLAALAGFIIISINSSSDATRVGLNGELDAIAAVAVGGTPLTGGQASIIGTLIGALIIYLIGATLVSQNVSFGVAQVIKAAIILLAVYLQRQRKA